MLPCDTHPATRLFAFVCINYFIHVLLWFAPTHTFEGGLRDET